MNSHSNHWKSPSVRRSWVHGERKGRGLRILPKNMGYFVHVTSRTRGQAFLLGDAEKRSFLLKMRQWADFSGIGVLTHCLMSNHFHLLLWVPEVKDLSHDEIVSRLRQVWPEEKVEAWEKTYDTQAATGQALMDRNMVDRMGNLPAFMRVLKQSFSNWYNHREGCRGTFWEGRYRSVVVEHNPLALLSVAAYIDLNPLRAGLVTDPLDAVWTGYGAACGGNLRARQGLHFLVKCAKGSIPDGALAVRRKQLIQTSTAGDLHQHLTEERHKRSEASDWQDVQKTYRLWLYAKGNDGSQDPQSAENSKSRQGIPPEEVLAEFERQGDVPQARLLRQKWRSYTRGVGIGSAPFLEDLFRQYRSCFAPKRKKTSTNLKNHLPGLQTLRQPD